MRGETVHEVQGESTHLRPARSTSQARISVGGERGGEVSKRVSMLQANELWNFTRPPNAKRTSSKERASTLRLCCSITLIACFFFFPWHWATRPRAETGGVDAFRFSGGSEKTGRVRAAEASRRRRWLGFKSLRYMVQDERGRRLQLIFQSE